MLLDELVAASERVAATRARLEKLALLAELLRRLRPDEIETATAFLAGELRQGRVGLGHYRMRGFYSIKSQADYDAWLKETAAAELGTK